MYLVLKARLGRSAVGGRGTEGRYSPPVLLHPAHPPAPCMPSCTLHALSLTLWLGAASGARGGVTLTRQEAGNADLTGDSDSLDPLPSLGLSGSV